jgi:hypothetical protein
LQESLAPGTFYGIRKDVVTEFKIVPNLEIPLRRHRKWEVQEGARQVLGELILLKKL